MKDYGEILAFDREDISDIQRELFLKDFSRLADEYFENDSKPTIEITRSEGGFLLCVIWTARRAKSVKSVR